MKTRPRGRAAGESCLEQMELRLGELQREVRAQGIPVIIVFEGMSAAGKGTLINDLLLCLDPRGFNVYPIKPAGEQERFHPFLWRFWLRTPERGRIAIFDRSWYRRVLDERIDKEVKRREWRRAFEEIASFERQLIDDGAVMLKFFLHVDKKEQKKRFLKLLKHQETAWRVTKRDWEHHRRYRAFAQAAQEMMAATHSPRAPWLPVDSADRERARQAVFAQVIAALEDRIASPHLDGVGRVPAGKTRAKSILGSVDASASLDRASYDSALRECQKKIRELEHRAYVERLPVEIVYEGWDAAGKGGNIRRLARALDPRGYEVIPVAAPSDEEKRHHYLWRFWRKAPKAGHLAIFDRSWYGRVLVERVEELCTEEQWRRAYLEINEMEKQWADFGTVLVKLWLHIDQEEQLRRFKARQASVHKRWKITEEDWRNREKWDRYRVAVDDMLRRTNTPWAPWTVVGANCKLHARIEALQSVIAAIRVRL